MAAAAHLDQIEADIARIVDEAQQHVEQVRLEEAAAAAAVEAIEEEAKSTPRSESRIPVVVAKSTTSSPSPQSANKTKTIKKHSKVAAKSFVRPAVGDIEWDTAPVPTERITEISTLQLEDVTSPNEHESSEPVVILSPGDDYSGEIDEVILVQTPGDDADIDEDDDLDDGTGFSPQRQRIITTTTTTTTTSINQPPPQLTFSTTDDDLPTISLSLQSDDSDEDDRQQSSPATKDQQHPGASSTKVTILEQHHQQPQTVIDKLLTFGSSSGSDVALHEPGAEPSDDDEPGELCLGFVGKTHSLSFALYLSVCLSLSHFLCTVKFVCFFLTFIYKFGGIFNHRDRRAI